MNLRDLFKNNGAWACMFLVCLLILLFSFVSVTSRARLNLLQAFSLIFISIIIVRFFLNKEQYSTKSWFQLVWPWLGVTIAIISWASMLGVFFIGDDFAHLAAAQNWSLQSLWEQVRYGQAETFLRPIGFASIFLDYSIWGSNPIGFHLTNLLIHFISVGGLFVLVRQLGGEKDIALATAGIFAAMPVQVETVAWMGARFDLLSVCFSVWSIVCYLWSRSKSNNAGYALGLVLYLLAILSKESGFVVPLLIAAIELLTFPTIKILRTIGFFAFGAAVFLYRILVLGGVGGYSSEGKVSALHITSSTFEGLLVRGPTQTLFGFNWSHPPDWLLIGLSSVLVALLIHLAFNSRRETARPSLVKLGLCWMFFAMLPAHFLLMVGPNMNGSRVLYMSSIGAAIILGQLLGSLVNGKTKTFAWISLIAVLNLGVIHNIQAWRFTGELSKDLLHQLVQIEPNPAPGTTFVISDTPTTVQGVFFFNVGLMGGVRIAYNREDISAFTAVEIERRSDRNPASEILLVWDDEKRRLLKR